MITISKELVKAIIEKPEGNVSEELKDSRDLAHSRPHVAKIQVVALTRKVYYVEIGLFKCSRCGYMEFSPIDRVKAGKCPKCSQGDMILHTVHYETVKAGKVMIDLKDAGPTTLDAVFTEEVLGIRGGSYTCIVRPVPIRKKNCIEPMLVVYKMLDEQNNIRGDASKLEKYVRQMDFEDALRFLAEGFMAHRIYSLLAERLLALAILVGAYSDVFTGEDLKRWWMHGVFVGNPETGKSLIIEAIRKVVPYSKCVLLAGGKQTIPGLLVGSTPGGAVYEGPFLLLDGDYTNFGVIVLEEANELPKSIWNELRDPMERGEYYRSLATSGIIGGRARTSLIVSSNWATIGYVSKAHSIPEFLRDPALVSRFDVFVFTFQYCDNEVDMIVKYNIENLESCFKPEDYREYILKARSIVAHVHKCDRLYKVLTDYRKELISALNSTFSTDSENLGLSGIRLAMSILRLAVALTKLTLRDTVEPRAVEYAGKLLLQQFEKFENLRNESKLRPGQALVLNTVLSILYRKVEMMKQELIEEVIAKLNRTYEVYVDDVEKAIEKLKQEGKIIEPEVGKVRLVV